MLTIHTTRPIYSVTDENPRQWNADRIREYYDQNPSIMLAEYARMLGLSVPQLKKILTQ